MAYRLVGGVGGVERRGREVGGVEWGEWGGRVGWCGGVGWGGVGWGGGRGTQCTI